MNVLAGTEVAVLYLSPLRAAEGFFVALLTRDHGYQFIAGHSVEDIRTRASSESGIPETEFKTGGY